MGAMAVLRTKGRVGAQDSKPGAGATVRKKRQEEEKAGDRRWISPEQGGGLEPQASMEIESFHWREEGSGSIRKGKHRANR